MTTNLILGDCLEKLKDIKSNSIDAVVTDPPYELGFMGKKWDSTGIAYNINIWIECLRVLKPGGHLLVFGGTRTYHRMAVAIEDAGFEVRDMLEWIYASGFPKSLNVGKAVDKLQGNEREVIGKDKSGSKRNCMAGDFTGGEDDLTKGTSTYEGYGTALKPAHEPIIMARKPLSEKTIVENVLKHGTGAIDIDGCRIPTNTYLTGSDLFDKIEILCQSNLSHLFVDNAGKKKFPEDTTRKIKNLFSAVGNVDMPTSEKILGKIAEDISKMDIGCSEEMLMESISTSLNTYISGKNTTGERNQEDLMSTTLTENETTTEKKTSNSLQEANTSNSIGRFPANCICTDDALNDGLMTKSGGGNKSNKVEKGRISQVPPSLNSLEFSVDVGSKSRYFDIDVWAEKYGLLQFPKASKRERGQGNTHPTVKPVHLMSWLVRLVSKEGDTILDPFMGSGTTGVSSVKLNRNFIGIELNEEYINIAKARIYERDTTASK